MSGTPQRIEPLSLTGSPTGAAAAKKSTARRWQRGAGVDYAALDAAEASATPSGSQTERPTAEAASPAPGALTDRSGGRRTVTAAEPQRSRSSSVSAPGAATSTTTTTTTTTTAQFPKPDVTSTPDGLFNYAYDFEKLLDDCRSQLDPTFAFPSQPIASLLEQPRQHRALDRSQLLPDVDQASYSVTACMALFSSNWIRLIRDYGPGDLSSESSSSSSSSPSSSLHDVVFSDPDAARNTAAAAPLLGGAEGEGVAADVFRADLLNPQPAVTSDADDKCRRPVFDTISRQAIEEETKTPQALKLAALRSNLFEQQPAVSVLIEPKELTWDLGDFEPMWCTVAAYDVSTRRRVSENFSFAPNSFFSNKLIGLSAHDEAQQTKKAVLTFSRASPDIFLVLRIEKILQGDLDDIAKPYLEGTDFKVKYREKLTHSIADFSSRLRPYRQLFGWSMLPLFDSDDGKISSNELQFTPIFRHKSEMGDDALLESISATVPGSKSKNTGTRRARVLRGHLTLNVQVITDYAVLNPCRLYSSSFVQLNPNARSSSSSSSTSSSSSLSSSSSSSDPILRELQEFTSEERFLPVVEYCNNLFVYPQQVTMNKPDSYCLRVYFLENDRNGVLDTKNLEPHSLPLFYDALTTTLKRSLCSTVVYKSKSPVFMDELKLQLPPQLQAGGHHLLFAVMKVRTKAAKKNQPAAPETPIAFGFLPLYSKDGVFAGVEHDVQLFAELPAGYLSLPVSTSSSSHHQGATLRPLDGGKPLFKFRLVLSSSLYTQDRPLSRAMSLFSGDTADLLKNTSSLAALRDVAPALLMTQLPLVLQHLIGLVCGDTTQSGKPHQGLEDLANEALVCLCHVLQRLLEHDAHTPFILQSYVLHLFQPRNFHDQLAMRLLRRWLAVLSLHNGQDDSLVLFAQFFFGLIFKSMLANTPPLPSYSRSLELFPRELYPLLYNTVAQMIWEAQERTTTRLVTGRDLIYALVFFIQDLFAIVDRGFVIQLVALLATRLCPSSDVPAAELLTLIDFKFSFLRTIASFKYWVHLNLPVPRAQLAADELASSFASRHYLASLLLTQLASYAGQRENSAVRLLAYVHLRTHLYDLHYDARYRQAKQRSQVAQLYFPYVISVVDRIGFIQSASHAEKRNAFLSFVYLLSSVPSALFRQWWTVEGGPSARLLRFLETLRICLEVFEYVGSQQLTDMMGVDQGAQASDSTKAQLEEFYAGTAGPRYKPGRAFRSLRSPTKGGASPGGGSGGGGSGGGGGKGPMTAKGFAFDELREANLSSECAFTVLDVLSDFVSFASASLHSDASYGELFARIVHVYMHCIRLNQPIEFLGRLYASLRGFVRQFADQLFKAREHALVAELVNVLVCCHCNSPFDAIRSQATATLYLMMQLNYAAAGDGTFTRMKVQLAHATAKLEGVNTRHLQSCVRSMLEHAAAQAAVDGVFAAQVVELCTRLGSILRDMDLIIDNADNLEKKHELYLQVAQAYVDVPDLRVLWLEKLAVDHAANAQWAEAAAVYLHLAALSCECLCIRQRRNGTSNGDNAVARHRAKAVWPNGIAELARALSSNIAQERLPDELVLRDTDSVCESPVFDGVAGLLRTCEEAVVYLHKATLWESVYKVYKLLLPVYEHQRQFGRLTSLFDDLAASYEKVAADRDSRSRTLGTYYRVAFWGSIFGDEQGHEYIYKLPQLTRLGEIKARLEHIYQTKYGADRIAVWPKNEPPDSVPSDRGYIQITAVEPWFDSEQLARNRTTYYEQNWNVNRFCYETAFTQGQQHADSIANQWKRQIILVTEHKFPTLKNRLRIVGSDSVDISPIEASIDNIEDQARKLSAEVKSGCSDAKNLQRLLQGSLIVQVQAGPKAIANTFFRPDAVNNYDPKHIDRLKSAFQSLLKGLKDAIAFNRILAPDKIMLQEELDQSYTNFENLLADLGVIQSVVRRFQSVQR